MALHSGSDEHPRPPRARFATVADVPAGRPFELFHVEPEQVVLTAVPDDRSALVISSWRPGRGVTRAERT